MRRALKFDDFGVKAAMRHPAIAGKKPIARGMFSAIFESDKPGRVWKMTVDSVGYRLLNCCAAGVSGKHFPKTYRNERGIGKAWVGGERLPIYLFEMERLEELSPGSPAKKAARDLMHLCHRTWGGAGHLRSTVDREELKFPKPILTALTKIDNFCRAYKEAHLDMHMGNFMQRKNGDLVISDPVCNVSTFSRVSGRIARFG